MDCYRGVRGEVDVRDESRCTEISMEDAAVEYHGEQRVDVGHMEGSETGWTGEGKVESLRKSEQMPMLEKYADWEKFDVFEFSRQTKGKPLQTLVTWMLHRTGLVGHMHLDVGKMQSFLSRLEDLYEKRNPYHSSTHAADVVQAIATMLEVDSWAEGLPDWELLSFILAAAAHDVGHQGLSNHFHCAAESRWFREYGKESPSVNEYGHMCITIAILEQPGSNFLVNVDDETSGKIKELIKLLIMDTDMRRHGAVCDELEACLRGRGPRVASWPQHDRVKALSAMLHFADISNPGRPWELTHEWGIRVQEEQFLQGDEEIRLGLAVSRNCDRKEDSTSHNQLKFISNVMKPFSETIAVLAPNFIEMINIHVQESLQKWKADLNGMPCT